MNPIQRQDALQRVLNQVLAYAAAHPTFAVEADSMTLPTEYDVAFEQPGFRPPAVPGGEPEVIGRHEVLIQLGPEFPAKPPAVYWLTPVFHPNVYPNYDSPQHRENPNAAGLLCLGLLDTGWYPAYDFRDLCQTIVDIAGYRNYDIFETTGADAAGPQLRGNFYDPNAAGWALDHQADIEAIGGRPVIHRPPVGLTYDNVIEQLE
ncbi:ubiquitin-conjugating enzyme E2 [Dactylosporangium sp. NPDC049525]|uniref:ubiquitin-conjugating enzyme E2 n=1 Tax=Dactylosporangium sp. NPDC049525 TaxID=3154730 RepID=UPI003416D94C